MVDIPAGAIFGVLACMTAPPLVAGIVAFWLTPVPSRKWAHVGAGVFAGWLGSAVVLAHAEPSPLALLVVMVSGAVASALTFAGLARIRE